MAYETISAETRGRIGLVTLNRPQVLNALNEALLRELGAAVDSHLERYFLAHGDGLPPAGLYARVLREVEKPLISMTLSATRGNQIRAAELLGLNRNTLRKKIRELEIPVVRGVK